MLGKFCYHSDTTLTCPVALPFSQHPACVSDTLRNLSPVMSHLSPLVSTKCLAMLTCSSTPLALPDGVKLASWKAFLTLREGQLDHAELPLPTSTHLAFIQVYLQKAIFLTMNSSGSPASTTLLPAGLHCLQLV